MTTEELRQQFRDADVEYEPQIWEQNNETFWHNANEFPETIEFEITSMFRLREKVKTSSMIDQLNNGSTGKKKEDDDKDKENKPKEYLAYSYYVYYYDSRTHQRIGRDFNDGGIKVDATFKDFHDERRDYLYTDLDRLLQSYTIPFTVENVRDILENQTVTYAALDDENNVRLLKKQKNQIQNQNRKQDEDITSKLKMKKRKCPVINQDRIQYYIGTISDTAYSLTNSKDDIRVDNGLDWLNLSYGQLIEKHKEEEREKLAARLQQQQRKI